MRASFLLLLATCGGCPPPAQPGTTVVDSAGVAVVENRGADRPLSWPLALPVIIGGVDSAIVMSQLTEYTVDADSLGHIFVLDSWFGHRVQQIDTAGHLVRVLTRAGAGPGEVGEGVSISASGDGTVAVLDQTKMGMVRVRWDGAVLPLLPLTGYELFGGARATADTVILHTLDPSTTAYAEQIRYRAGADTATLVEHRPHRLPYIPFCRDGMEGLTPMLTPELRWTARGGRALITRSGEYRIDDFQGGRLVRSIRRDVRPVAGTVEAVTRFFPDGKIIGSRDCIVPPGELAQKRGVSEVVQPIRRLALDWEGRIWAERNTFPDEPGRVDVFDKSGRYLGTLAGHGAPLGFPGPGLVLFALPDSASDAPKLALYHTTQ